MNINLYKICPILRCVADFFRFNKAFFVACTGFLTIVMVCGVFCAIFIETAYGQNAIYLRVMDAATAFAGCAGVTLLAGLICLIAEKGLNRLERWVEE